MNTLWLYCFAIIAEAITSLKAAEQERLRNQIQTPIDRPQIHRDQAGDFRLTSPRTLLGLELHPVDGGRGRLNRRGQLKDMCWKLLLVSDGLLVGCYDIGCTSLRALH